MQRSHVFLLALAGSLWPAEAEVKVSAFNIQVFGVSKMEDQNVVDVLIQILLRNDLVLIQEIRDASETAIYDLFDQLNEVAGNDQFEMTISERLGRTSSKEQYAYFYRPNKVALVDTYQYPEERDYYERPPYVARFITSDADVSEFAFMGVHTKPDDADAEIDKLVDVYDEVVERWGIEDVLIGGDLNAGCDYVCQSCWDDIRLRTDPRFLWVIGDDVDTTVTTTDCPYDRFVLAGSNLQSSHVQGSAGPFLYDDEYQLSQDEALEVSDHYPVDVDLA